MSRCKACDKILGKLDLYAERKTPEEAKMCKKCLYASSIIPFEEDAGLLEVIDKTINTDYTNFKIDNLWQDTSDASDWECE